MGAVLMERSVPIIQRPLFPPSILRGPQSPLLKNLLEGTSRTGWNWLGGRWCWVGVRAPLSWATSLFLLQHPLILTWDVWRYLCCNYSNPGSVGDEVERKEEVEKYGWMVGDEEDVFCLDEMWGDETGRGRKATRLGHSRRPGCWIKRCGVEDSREKERRWVVELYGFVGIEERWCRFWISVVE